MISARHIPVTELKGVGPRLAEKLQKLRIHNIQDLVFHLPSRYQDRTRLTPITHLNDGQFAVVEAEVVDSRVQHGKRTALHVTLKDQQAVMTMTFFYFSAQQHAKLTPGVRLLCIGEAKLSAYGASMIHPEYQLLGQDQSQVEASLTPIYPSTEGLNQAPLRKHIQQALDLVTANPGMLADLIPNALLEQHFPYRRNIIDTVTYLHRPPPEVSATLLAQGAHATQQRLVIEELMAHHLSLLMLRQRQQMMPAPAFTEHATLSPRLRAALPFTLTSAQQRVIEEIEHDVRNCKPMLRLLQGDVGSGKTIVAACAALRAIECGYQAALMAPTELLAEQHYRHFSTWFEALGVTTNWLTGKHKSKHKKAVRKQLQDGQLAMVIGTHALFQENIQFSKLGLIIIDEQHRFGVNQRLALKEKGGDKQPHQLIMTATPIPRTLAMTAYANLDVSVIDELPPGRKPIITAIVPNSRREEVITRVHDACQHGRQVYWVCTLIEESEVLQCEAAQDSAELLQSALPDVRVALIHGRLPTQEKESTMAAFVAGEVQLLVATTVIEVGVDAPNASLMIIENAERFGLAQLHQLRGRVGRSTLESHCLLMYQHPLSQVGKQRLGVMRETVDGFEIANQDLAIRGPGEVLGTRQTGLMTFKIADLTRDEHLIPTAQTLAKTLLQEYPEHAREIINRWIGEKNNFAAV